MTVPSVNINKYGEKPFVTAKVFAEAHEKIRASPVVDYPK